MLLVSLLSSLSSLDICDEESLRSGGDDRSLFSCNELLVLEPSGGIFLNWACTSEMNGSLGRDGLGG